MPQPKRSSSSSRSRSTGGARKSKSGSSRGTTQKRAAAAQRTARQRKAASPKSTASKRRAPSRAKSKAKSGASTRATSASRSAPPAEDVRRNVQNALETLSHGVVITRERLQEVFDDAVKRGRMTRGDANSLASDLLKRGRDQTKEVRKQVEALRSDMEQLLGRAGGDLSKRATDARRRAVRGTAGDRALREVDRARSVAGLGRFPILNYEDLTAGQISERLADLSPAELRKVRDHERRNANRKSVLSAVEKALS
jgi:polyhydroxyalkanoate synthesis regulator phasin